MRGELERSHGGRALVGNDEQGHRATPLSGAQLLTRSQERGPDTPAGVCCALCRLPTDKGYQGAGIGVHTPIKGFHLEIDSRAYNELVSGMCAIGERSNALLGQRWAALRHVSLSPSRIGDIVAAALVPTSRERGTR